VEHAGVWSLLPALTAIVLAVATRKVFLSLFLGIWFGWTVMEGGNPLTGFVTAVDALLKVFTDMGNARVVVFSGLVGGLLALTQRSGGVEGFVKWMSGSRMGQSRVGAQLLTWVIGLVIFVESSITCLIAGSVSRPLYDRLRISREKLAYICDSTSAPVCVLIPLNGWGAFVMGLLAAQHVESPLTVLAHAVPFNVYAITAVLLVLVVILARWNLGPMKKAETRATETGQTLRQGAKPLIAEEITSMTTCQGATPRSINLVLPLGLMVLLVPVVLWWSGDGDILKGSGSTAVFWAVLLALLFAAVLVRLQGIMGFADIGRTVSKGVIGLAPMMALMVLAFAIGSTCKQLGTGHYLADLVRPWLSPGMLPALMFVVSCVMALSTGTSWGTFATMVPIGVPMVMALGADPAVTLAAILGGGTFGDHCSPLSDTSIIASMASASDHIDHVRTQFPYALIAALMAFTFYLVWGLM
jgi:Na+/H+ antiporter NhaC